MNSNDVAVLKGLIDSVSINVHRTRGGSLAVTFTESGGGDKPLLGAYYSGNEWIVCQWDTDGLFISEEQRKLDLIMVSATKEIA